MVRRETRGLFVTRFFRGAGCLFRAVGVIAGSRRILLFSLVPFLICAVIYVGFFVAALFLADNLADLMVQAGTWWRSLLRILLICAFYLVCLLIGIFTYSAACLVIAAPLYEFLSAAVERRATGGVQEEPFSLKNMLVDVWRALVGTVVILAIEVGVLMLGLVLALVAAVLVPVTAPLAVLASAVLLSLEYVDYPMGRRRMPLREKLGFARRHVWEFLGLGLPMLAGLAIPFVGVVFVPMGVVGGTLLFVDLTRNCRPNPD